MRTPYRTIKGDNSSGGGGDFPYGGLVSRDLYTGYEKANQSTFVSWIKDGIAYAFVLSYSHDSSSGLRGTVSCLTKREGEDIINKTTKTPSSSSGNVLYSKIGKKEGSVVAVFYFTSRNIYYRVEWNYATKDTPESAVAASDESLPEGYTEFTDNERIKSVNYDSVNPRQNYRITL